MIVLYTTTSSRNVKMLETGLQQHFWEWEGLDAGLVGGGVGMSADGPYYLYVVLSD